VAPIRMRSPVGLVGDATHRSSRSPQAPRWARALRLTRVGQFTALQH
jgi:hypothetical protein